MKKLLIPLALTNLTLALHAQTAAQLQAIEEAAYQQELARLQAASTAAAPPQKPGSNATRADWIAYDNAVSAWNQRQAADKAAAAQAEAQRQALAAAEYRAILKQLQAEQEAKAAALRQEQRDQRLLDLIEQRTRLLELELLRKQGKLSK